MTGSLSSGLTRKPLVFGQTVAEFPASMSLTAMPSKGVMAILCTRAITQTRVATFSPPITIFLSPLPAPDVDELARRRSGLADVLLKIIAERWRGTGFELVHRAAPGWREDQLQIAEISRVIGDAGDPCAPCDEGHIVDVLERRPAVDGNYDCPKPVVTARSPLQSPGLL